MYATRLCAAFLICVSAARAQESFSVDGDPIGPDTSTTDHIGGFTAVEQVGLNLGQPAIQVTLNGQELLTDLRVIVFGLPSADGELFFNHFDYHLDVWRRSDYFAGGAPQFRVDLGQPTNVSLVPAGANRIVPSTQFGTSGLGGGNAPTYDFHFELTQLPSNPPQNIFSSPLAAGDWVFGFQSWHNTEQNGTLRVSGASADEGPLPLFSRDSTHPRGVLGGQNPNDIAVYWGMTLSATLDDSPRAGDFNGNSRVDAADFVVWRKLLGAASETGLNNNGDGLNGVDAGDYQLWRRNFGSTGTAGAASAAVSNTAVVAEPTSAIVLVLAGCGLNFLRHSRRRIQVA